VLSAFTTLLQKRMAALQVGPGLNPNSTITNNTIGPLIDPQALAKVQSHVDDAKAQGGTVLLGGTPHPLGGRFYAPTLIANCHAGMRLAQEETFGPVAALFAFNNEEEVLQQANHSPFGLAAYFYTENLSRSLRVARALEYGMVGVNVGSFSNEVGPFGGIKQSGLGREGSAWGLDEFLEMKYVCMGIQGTQNKQDKQDKQA
jgi:succinate-semialdehyde dehydrogenase/glutarate-semialdehyde dehydrogenase